MREIAFIKQNKSKWVEYEDVVYNNRLQTPDYLANMYLQIMNDLSYAQSFYPKSKVTQYLNQLSIQTYQKIYKTKRIEQNRFVYFFKTEVPLLVYQYRNHLFFAVAIFLLIVSIGFLSAANDLGFIRLILGDYYVDTTLENIKKGDPMAIYQSGSNWGSFISITFNNLMVGLNFFILGIFLGVGTLLYMVYNGIMLGAFQYLFIQENAFMDSFRGIWLHGAMEITGMVLEGFAGFVLGSSILFPKTFSRINSFKTGFTTGLKIYIATIPFTVFAGFIEGYVTRYAKSMPDVINYIIIFGTLGLIVYYFFIYPFKVAKQLKNKIVDGK
ncbi:MAG: stage II sporulation protein M [Flavobacteriaceae bacterium]|jgi:uncharacterized membrane protein SpoIIM required for sporulation|nr:stage II sporulation protein M [Flavobacteriaceae bacterium]